MHADIKRRQIDGDALSSELHPVIDRIYRARQISSLQAIEKQAKGLLHYQHLNGIERAIEVLSAAVREQKSIKIIGDFDADGATSTALCMLALQGIGAKDVSYLVPNRFDFGYGLSPAIVDVAKQNNAQVIITVDSGIACLDGVNRAKELGMQVVITDHHLPGDSLPDADAIVNPNLPSCDFDSKNLAGVGVAFYVLTALRAHLQQQGWFVEQHIQPPSMAQWLDIVAIGTVADVVTLDTNNRILVHQGLQRIRAGRCRPGITAMLEIANRPARHLTASDLGFVIGPRLNAAGRLDDMALGIECLLCDDLYQARQKAAQLDSLNQERKHIEQSMKQDAERLVEHISAQQGASLPSALVLHDPTFHQGVIGIVAGRIKEKFDRPTIAFAEQDENALKGSARSVPGVHIRDALEEVQRFSPNLIDKFGGHAMAAGLTLQKMHLAQFTQEFNQVIGKMRETIPERKTYLTDGSLPASDLTLEFVNLLHQAGPFGQGFAPPSFDDKFTLVSQRIVGQKHLKMVLRDTSGNEQDAIAFNVDVSQWPNKQVSQVHLVYSPELNTFRGQTRVQLLVEYIQAC